MINLETKEVMELLKQSCLAQKQTLKDQIIPRCNDAILYLNRKTPDTQNVNRLLSEIKDLLNE